MTHFRILMILEISIWWKVKNPTFSWSPPHSHRSRPLWCTDSCSSRHYPRLVASQAGHSACPSPNTSLVASLKAPIIQIWFEIKKIRKKSFNTIDRSVGSRIEGIEMSQSALLLWFGYVSEMQLSETFYWLSNISLKSS